MKTLTKQLSWLDDQQPNLLALTQELCDVNSGTFNLAGLETVTGKLVREFSSLDGVLKIVPSLPYAGIDDDGRAFEQSLGSSVRISKWPDANKRVLLCIHMDTVYPVDHPFQRCELLENGTLRGPGVADAKGGLVVMLNALRTLERSPWAGQLGWEVLINPDEEIGSPGSVGLIQELAHTCDFGLLFEPSLPDGTLVSWRKGSGNFVFVVRGRSAHAGREFEKGRNAIVALSRLMILISEFNTDPEVTYNVGRIRGGGPLNVVPDLAIGRVNVRVKTVEQAQAVEQQFAALAQTFSQQHNGIELEVSGSFTSPPKQLSPAAVELQRQVEACGQALDIDIKWQGTGGACDGNKFASAGLPNLDTLGPCGGNIHSPEEYLIPESLVPRTKLAALMLLKSASV